MSHELLEIGFQREIGEMEVRCIQGSGWVHVSNERTGDVVCIRSGDALRDVHYALGQLIRQIDERRAKS